MPFLARWLLLVAAPGCLTAQQFQFMPIASRPAASFVTVGGPVRGGFAIGDVDGDGLRDIVVCESTTGRVVLGSLAVSPLPGTLDQQRPLLRDLDGDGDLDLVLAGYRRRLQVMRNDAGSFVAIALPAAFSRPTERVVLGDLDRDGDDDFVVAIDAGAGQSLVLLRNDGAMQFTLDATIFPSLGIAAPQSPALVDFDGDGDLDVVVWAPFVGTRLLGNTGTGFTDMSSQLPTVPTWATVACSGDFDGDGRVDVALLEQGVLDVLWGTGSGFTLQAPALALPSTTALEPFDLDGDGVMELVGVPPGVLAIRNRGGRTFAASPLLVGTIAAYALCAFDGDALPDLVYTTDAAPQIVQLLLGTGVRADAGFVIGPKWPVSVVRSSTPSAGDVDGDGRTDLLIPAAGELVVDHALGDGRYAVTESLQVRGTVPPEQPHLADLDNDGDLDLVVAAADALQVYGNDGAGNFARLLRVPTTTVGVDDTRLGDVDADGLVDIVRAVDGGIRLIRNLGAGTFAPAAVLATGTVSNALELWDVDGDGDLDIVTTVPAPFGASVLLLNAGNGTFAPGPVPIVVGGAPRQIVRADFDGDGDQDLLVENAAASLVVMRNNGAGSWFATQTVQLQQPGTRSNLVARDVDGDGDVDLLFVVGNALQLNVNDGTGSLASATIQRVAPVVLNTFSPWGIRVADVDDDGDPDVLLGSAAAAVGEPQLLFLNNLRQLQTRVPPRVGSVAEFALYNGPGFGTLGSALLACSFARAAAPLQVPVLLGSLQLDAATAQVLAAVPTSSIGISSVFVPVPPSAQLAGLEVWLQGAILSSAQPPGLTNAIYEVVLR